MERQERFFLLAQECGMAHKWGSTQIRDADNPAARALQYLCLWHMLCLEAGDWLDQGSNQQEKVRVMDAHDSQHDGSLPISKQLTLSVLWFGLNFQNAALQPIVIPTQILLFISPKAVGTAQQATFLGWISTAGALLAVVLPPVVGALSDKTRGKMGRRRPYILGGSIFLVLGPLVLAMSKNAWLFLLGLLLYSLGNNVASAGYQGLIPDLVPESQRGAASGYMGVMTVLGNIGSLLLAALLLGAINTAAPAADVIQDGAGLFYLITAPVLLLTVLVTHFGAREAPLNENSGASRGSFFRPSTRQRWVTQWIDPWRDRNFTWVFLTRAFVMMGLTLFLTFIEYYFANVAGISQFVQFTAGIAILTLLGAILSAFVLGVFSDHTLRTPVVAGATTCMAVAALAFVLFPNSLLLWPPGLLFGLGYGAYTSVDWALAIDALPSLDNAGKDLGLWGASSNLPAILAPALGSVIIFFANQGGQTAQGYRLIFILAAIFFFLGALLVGRVRADRDMRLAKEQQRAQRRHPGFFWRLARNSHAGQARGLLHFWIFWEHFTARLWHVQTVPGTAYGLLAVQVTRYHGRPIDLPDGVHVGPGDHIVVLHFQNRALTRQAEQGPWELLRRIGEDMQGLATWLQSETLPADIKAVYGLTLLSRAAPRLGFTLRPRPRTLMAWFDRTFMQGLLVLYNAAGLERLTRGTTYSQYPQEAWISRQELLRRYHT
jgi:MFS family permease